MIRFACLCLLAATALPALAIDTIYVVGEEKRVAGEITNVTRDAITVNSKVGGDTEIPANKIEKIEFDGEPPNLRLVRTTDENGRFAEAIDEYTKLLTEIGDNEVLEGEIAFLIARAKGRLGEADSQKRQEGIDALKAYTDKYRTHYRFYDAQLLYGKLTASAGDNTRAQIAFDAVSKSPFNDYQLAAKVALADSQFAEGDIDSAAKLYDEVAGTNGTLPREKSQKLAALLGKAKVLSNKKQYDEAIKALETVIQQTTVADSAVQAEAYLRQGDAYAASGGNPKAAVMAYLFVDVVPSLSKETSKHAEALYRLSQMWPAVGQPGRAAEASARLQSMYPNSEWTAKLNG